MDDEPFQLTGDMVARLRSLAETTRKSGHGMLASANYFGQGYVDVPSAWLAEIIDHMDQTGLPSGTE